MKRAVSFLLSLLMLLSVLPISAAAAGNYTYTDPANGNSFTVDTDWVQQDLVSDPMYQVKFTHTQKTGGYIAYGSRDVWSQLSLQEQQATPRGSYDHTMYTPKEIADYLSVRERFVQTITIGGNTYFRAEAVSSSFIFFEVRTTHFVHIRNGWLYLYSFNGSRYDSGYSDFRKLVSSSVFPAAEPIPSAETASTEPAPSATMPVGTLPSATTPAETVPPTTTPAKTTPLTTVPVETIPPTTAPIETVPPTTAPTEVTSPEDDIYKRAKAAYKREDYQEAQDLFSQIPTYLDSSDYLRLLRIRNYGGNIGIGAVYDFDKALTYEQKRDIDAAAENFDFADTARVLLWNVDVATYFLFGEWYTNDHENKKDELYIRWHTDSGGFYYTRSNKLSTAISNTVSIHDGYLRVDITTTNKLVFHITLTGPDTMELYCYEYDKTYTLMRS